MICRFSAGASALASAVGALAAFAAWSPAQAQTAPVVITVDGPCALALNGQAAPCTGVAYMLFPDNHRVDFTAITAQAGWAFSGDEDDKQDGHYTLTLDSLVSPQSGRMEAEGECDMQIEDDGVTVRSIECEAKTQAGTMQLRASGVAKAGDDSDDDDDDSDDRPDSGQG